MGMEQGHNVVEESRVDVVSQFKISEALYPVLEHINSLEAER